MKHLTVDEILDFVSLTELNKESIELSAKVNGHIRECEECLKLVRSFQIIYDEFTRLGTSGSFKNFAMTKVLETKIEKSTEIEELDGFL